MFFARFLRHFGRYSGRSDLVFPCLWCRTDLCDWCTAYGCPFPEVIDQSCGAKCCYRDPLAEIAKRPELTGRRLVLWWNEENKVDGVDLWKTLASFGHYYEVKEIDVPEAATGWNAYALSPNPGRSIGQRSAAGDQPRRVILGSDDSAQVMLNGHMVGEITRWQTPAKFDLPLGTERVLVAVEARNDEGPAGLVGAIVDWGPVPASHPAHWVCSTERQDDWFLPEFDDQGWTNPEVLAPHGAQPWGVIDVGLSGADWVWSENPARPLQTIYCRWWIESSSPGS
jgi:hypothetical protein